MDTPCEPDSPHPGLSSRYIGTLVADFHRNLMEGGVYYYPLDTRDRSKAHRKLRLMCEAIPLVFIAEQAGGKGSDRVRNVLDIEPESLHQRTLLYIGSRELVEKAEHFILHLDAV